ncbi:MULTISPECIES: hypothetical protein [unclassified Pseudovibrio]|uniref:hypothetical protein n=1 Tax=unclassified Pseudovibrio TaxID=2627060 RepID=UPI0007AE886A|nr:MULTISPECIES: hypothetical protein [unclassified Pseudovibrio]KZK92547.1 hypothetical protein PsW74_05474 [Pseudovibrio sp. W74]KZL03204.1 hypothetical protein PsAD14_05734 [Pseudovibrio sp. Ad14]
MITQNQYLNCLRKAYDFGQQANLNIVLALTELAGTPQLQIDNLQDAAKQLEKAAKLLRETADLSDKTLENNVIEKTSVDQMVVKQFKNDLEGMSDLQLSRELHDVEGRLDEDTPWLEALCAEQRIRADKQMTEEQGE